MNPVGKDMYGTELYPNDKVIVNEGQEDEETMEITLGTYRELMDFGDVYGYYIPDFCKKITEEND